MITGQHHSITNFTTNHGHPQFLCQKEGSSLHRRLKLKILIVVVMDLSFLAVTWFFAPPLTKLVAMSFIIQLTQCTTLETMSSQHLNSDQNRH